MTDRIQQAPIVARRLLFTGVLALLSTAVPHAIVNAADSPALTAGTLLIATDKLTDPSFAHSVILILRHDETGTLGLIVNHRTSKSLAQLIPRNKRLRLRTDAVYSGGPVKPGTLTMLMRSSSPPDELSALIFDDVYLSRDPKLLDRIVDEAEPDEPIDFRVYDGYSGWDAGQLTSEIERGDWRIVRGSADVLFTPQPGQIWKDLSHQDPRLIATQGLRFWQTALCLMGVSPSGDL